MESTGIYWKNQYVALETVGMCALGSPGTSKMCLVAKATLAMPNGWRHWRASAYCTARSCLPTNLRDASGYMAMAETCRAVIVR